tara:strand:- start:346 stop:750 length:405 start_codon:yes stop_codon:yes gene_type:complete
MGDEFYAAIKLVSGEEIFSIVCVDENDGDPVLLLQNPVIMKLIENNYGSMVKIRPWMEIPEDDFFIIKYDRVITMTEVTTPETINFYRKYLNEDNSPEGQVEITDKMGYVSSVEDARKTLENIFNKTKDTNLES